MQVHGYMRLIASEQGGHGARFGGFHLGSVTIEIEPLRILPCTHTTNRPRLRSAIGHAHPLITVGVVDGIDEQHGVHKPRVAPPVPVATAVRLSTSAITIDALGAEAVRRYSISMCA